MQTESHVQVLILHAHANGNSTEAILSPKQGAIFTHYGAETTGVVTQDNRYFVYPSAIPDERMGPFSLPALNKQETTSIAEWTVVVRLVPNVHIPAQELFLVASAASQR